jgi:hypothetical protein
MYEREQFPIPYQTAVTFADVLQIDSNMLLMSLPNLWIKPGEFCEKAKISCGIYAKWETLFANRQERCISN